jgi:Flp pilus assembly protein TadD
MRRALLAASCAAVTLASIACQQEKKVQPLREDPKLAAELKARHDRQMFYESAQNMSIEEAARLEKMLEQNPEDTSTRERLLTFYRWTGKNTQPWNDNVVARRRHALWLVEHHPDSDLLTSVRLSKREDPQGYAHARAMWLTAIDRREADQKVLSNAASFFEESEKTLAEEILFRAKAQYPDGPQPRRANGIYYRAWSERLGELYASAMAGSMGPYRTDEDSATQAWGRDRLERSSDGQVLYTAGIRLVYWPSKPEQRPFGKGLIMRASQLQSPDKESARDWLRRSAPQNRLEERLAGNATGGQRLRQLVSQAESEYLNAEYSNWRARQSPNHLEYSGNPKVDLEKAAAAFERSKTFAQQALDLAPSLAGTPDYPTAVFRAHMAAGLNALREGRRGEAVDHLLEASRLPAPKEPATEPRSLLEYRLVNYLLKDGERATIIEYLERNAPTRAPASRDNMLKAARAIRGGRMPEHYQRLLASGDL